MPPLQESSSDAIRKPRRDIKEIRALPDTDETPEQYAARMRQKQADLNSAHAAEMAGDIEIPPPRPPQPKPDAPNRTEHPVQEMPVIDQNYFRQCATFSSIVNRLEKMAAKNEVLYSKSGKAYDAKQIYNRVMDVKKGFEQAPIRNEAIIDSILAEKGITTAGKLREAVKKDILALG